MNRKIFFSGLIIFLICLTMLGFPFSSHVSSISETYSDCQKGTEDLRASFLMARGVCEISQISYYGLLLGILIGFVMIIAGILKKPHKVQNTY